MCGRSEKACMELQETDEEASVAMQSPNGLTANTGVSGS